MAGQKRITEYIDPEVMLPAIGQGALGIETRVDDDETNELVSFFDHRDTSLAVTAERALLGRLEGGCQVPIAAFGTIHDSLVKLTGLVASVDGKRIIKNEISGSVDDAEALGVELAETLLKSGGHEILSELYDVSMPKD